jgi:tellurite resistance protein TehA-like permease
VITASLVLSVAGLSQGGGVEAAGPEAVRTLGWGYGLSLITAWTLMLFCVSFYRISRESHSDNLERLRARSAAETP